MIQIIFRQTLHLIHLNIILGRWSHTPYGTESEYHLQASELSRVGVLSEHSGSGHQNVCTEIQR